MLSVYQHWDPLKVCLVGRSYPPEFYSFIKNPKVRNVFEKIAVETEEDYQKLINVLEKFKVKVIRTDLSNNFDDYYDSYSRRFYPPPMCPRDYCGMFGTNFHCSGLDFGSMLKNLTKSHDHDQITKIYPEIVDYFKNKDYNNIAKIYKSYYRTTKSRYIAEFVSNTKIDSLKTIKKYVVDNSSKVIYNTYANTATTTRVGKDLYFAILTDRNIEEKTYRKNLKYFENYRCHLIDANYGHSDSAFCPVKPGLIVGLYPKGYYEQTFPGWEVVHLPNQSWLKVSAFLDLKEKNKGKWWVPGEELNDDFTEYVETWMDHWVYYVEETVFDVNMLVIDEHNVICNNYNKKVFDAFKRHDITPHIVNFRHRYFWDGGLHCITSDIHREGEQKDFFPNRENKTLLYTQK